MQPIFASINKSNQHWNKTLSNPSFNNCIKSIECSGREEHIKNQIKQFPNVKIFFPFSTRAFDRINFYTYQNLFDSFKIKYLVLSHETHCIFNDKLLFYQEMIKRNLQDFIPKLYDFPNSPQAEQKQSQKIMQSINMQRCKSSQYILNKCPLSIKSTKIDAIEDKEEYFHFEPIKYPCILKKRKSVWGIGTFIIDNESDFKSVDLIKSNICEDYLLCEPILGNTEYGTHVLAANGEILFCRSAQYIFDSDVYVFGQKKIYDRSSFVSLEEIYPEVFDNIKLIVKTFNCSGFICIDHKIVENKIKIFEINPRIGGSLAKTPELLKELLIKYIDCVNRL